MFSDLAPFRLLVFSRISRALSSSRFLAFFSRLCRKGGFVNISVAIDNIAAYDADAIVVNLFEGVTEPGGATGAADRALNGQIRQLISGGDFTGKFKQVAVLYPQDGIVARRVILAGLGKSEDFALERVRQVSAVAAKRAQSLGTEHLASIIHGAGVGGMDAREAARAIVEGAILGTYRFTPYKSGDDDETGELEDLTLVEFLAEKRA